MAKYTLHVNNVNFLRYIGICRSDMSIVIFQVIDMSVRRANRFHDIKSFPYYYNVFSDVLNSLLYKWLDANQPAEILLENGY